MPVHGMNHPGAKLTPDDVELLRHERATWGTSYAILARQFGISLKHAWRVCRGLRRRDAAGPVAPLVGRGGQPQAFPTRNARNQRRYRAARRALRDSSSRTEA